MQAAKKILVAGGAGFLGSNLILRLLKEGHSIICVDNLQTGRLENLAGVVDHPHFEFIQHDICLPLPELPKLDQIYNLACAASPPKYQADPIHTFKTSIWGMLNLLELATKHRAVILQASTSEVYGDPLQHPQTEAYRGHVNPIGIRACYDEGKRGAETLCFDFLRRYQTKIKIIRIFNTYGPLMDPTDGRVISNFIMQALRNEDITLFGSGQQTRSFCYVDDLIDGMVRLMNSSDDFHGPVNVGNPDEFTVNELADMVIEKIKSDSKKVFLPLPQDDPAQRRPDISFAKEKLSWQPQISLSSGLNTTIDYFRQYL